MVARVAIASMDSATEPTTISVSGIQFGEHSPVLKAPEVVDRIAASRGNDESA